MAVHPDERMRDMAVHPDSVQMFENTITALRTALAEPEQTFMAEYKFRTYGYYQDADGKMQVGEIPEEMLTVSVEELIEKAVLAEREACADIAENWRCNGCPRTVLADQIRARGQE
jgi:hypothetical protein